MNRLQSYLSQIPLTVDNKLRLYRGLRALTWKIKYPSDIYHSLKRNQTMIPSGNDYGHEYWLKKYSSYSDTLYALVEHGVFFGNNESRVGWDVEWDVGNIITFGDYRYELLKELYPEHGIYKIGPRIDYSETDYKYYNELKNKIDNTSKVMTLYPSHSIESLTHDYDKDAFLEEAFALADELNIKNILLSLHPTDIINRSDDYYKDKNVILVTGGADTINFLPRLRAILELSDITFSNSLGTHVGYSIAMGKPHIMSLSSNNKNNSHEGSDVVHNKYLEEQLVLSKVFNGDRPFTISKEQKEAVDYYWGANEMKSKEELFKIITDCKQNYVRKFKNRIIKR